MDKASGQWASKDRQLKSSIAKELIVPKFTAEVKMKSTVLRPCMLASVL